MQEFDFNQYFESIDSEDSIAIMALMLLAFIFGAIITAILRGSKIRKLKNALREQEKETKSAYGAIEQLNTQIKEKDSNIQRLKYEIQEANAKSEKLDRDRTKFYNDAYQLKQRLEKADLSNQELAVKIDNLNAELNQIKQVNESLQVEANKVDDQTDDLAQMQSVFLATKRKIETLEDRLVRVENENDILKGELDKYAAFPNTDAPINPSSNQPSIVDAPVIEEEPPIEDNNDNQPVFQKINVNGQEKDDLTLIEGIGPFLEKQLNDLGIFTFAELGSIDENRIPELTRAIGHIPGRIERDDWVGQAKKLALQKAQQPETFTQKSVDTAPSALPQDLTIIEGIGPKIEALLNQSSIQTWDDLAEMDVDALKAILFAAGPGYQIIDPTTWPAQAQLAINGEWELLKEYREEVKGQ